MLVGPSEVEMRALPLAVAGRNINGVLTPSCTDETCADEERGESRVPIKLKNVDELNDHSTVKGHVDLS